MSSFEVAWSNNDGGRVKDSEDHRGDGMCSGAETSLGFSIGLGRNQTTVNAPRSMLGLTGRWHLRS